MLTRIVMCSIYRFGSIEFIDCYRNQVVQFNISGEVSRISVVFRLTYTCMLHVVICDSD